MSISILFLFLLILLPVIVGTYVYNDAKSRDMNALVWMLIAALAPFLIGLIIYLLVRSSHPNLKCPSCGFPVKEDFLICPECSQKLHPTCPNCNTAVESTFKLCPTCGESLPDCYPDTISPISKKDTALKYVVMAVIAIPLLYIIFGAISYNSISSVGGTGVTTLPASEYLMEVDNPKISDWYQQVSQDVDVASILENSYQDGETTVTRYLIYSPRLMQEASVSVESDSSFFRKRLTISFNGQNFSEPMVALITKTGEQPDSLVLNMNGTQLNCMITKTSEPLGLSEYK